MRRGHVKSDRVVVERVQTGVRMEKRLLKVLKALAELKDFTLGDLLEGIVLHAFEGKAPFSPPTLREIEQLRKSLWTDVEGHRQPQVGRKIGGGIVRFFALISALCCLPALLAVAASAQTSAPLHKRTEFSFSVDAPFAQVAPLFGADEERKWAADWNPQFIYPCPAHDQHGMVFRVEHGSHSSIWVNTAFDLAAGHIQYSYVLNDAMVTLIDIHLTREGEKKTK